MPEKFRGKPRVASGPSSLAALLRAQEIREFANFVQKKLDRISAHLSIGARPSAQMTAAIDDDAASVARRCRGAK
jgi:hypothetical protein